MMMEKGEEPVIISCVREFVSYFIHCYRECIHVYMSAPFLWLAEVVISKQCFSFLVNCRMTAFNTSAWIIVSSIKGKLWKKLSGSAYPTYL